MDTTHNLKLPRMMAGQAQKHVTYNEGLLILDTLVQLAVEDRDLADPPGSPSEGQRFIVAASPTGAWSNHENEIAVWQDGGWRFDSPQDGWLCFVGDEGRLLAWTGSAWTDPLSLISVLQNLSLLGVGTTADATNPFAAKLNNALWTAKATGEGGTGDLRYKMNKESAGNTLSLLMQTNYSGRAEIGLAGDDKLHIKTSHNGSTWREDLVIDSATGNIGIGTTSPAYALDIVTDMDTSTSGFRVTDSTSGGFFDVYSNASSGAVTIPTFRGESAGINGFGVAVVGQMPPTRDVANASAAIVLQGQRNDLTGLNATDVLRVKNYTTTLMTVDKDGNVGIGTTDPVGSAARVLHVSGTQAELHLTNTANGGSSGDGTSIQQWSDGNLYIWNRENASLFLGTNNETAVAINSSGSVGIGTTTPSEKLEVRGYLKGVEGNGSGTAAQTWARNLVLDSGDSVGMAFLSPNTQTATIHFGDPDDNDVGQISYSHATNELSMVVNAVPGLRLNSSRFAPGLDNVYSLGATTFRWSVVYAATGTIQTSDARDKDVTGRIDGAWAAYAVDTIEPALFRWKVGGNVVQPSATETEADEAGNQVPKMVPVPVPGKRMHAGFLAQDVKAAMDAAGLDFGAWGLDDKNDPDSRQWLRPDQLIPVLWAALRETRAELAALRALKSE